MQWNSDLNNYDFSSEVKRAEDKQNNIFKLLKESDSTVESTSRLENVHFLQN